MSQLLHSKDRVRRLQQTLSSGSARDSDYKGSDSNRNAGANDEEAAEDDGQNGPRDECPLFREERRRNQRAERVSDKKTRIAIRGPFIWSA